jgi:catechol 2,3-dioxygenase-like lactoylglutathione lyase family enzyme
MPFFKRKLDTSTTKTRKFFANATPPHIVRLSWLGLKVADITGQAIFFEESLGIRSISEGTARDGHHVLYELGSLHLELYEGGATWATQPKPRNGTPDIALVPGFLVDDIQSVAMELRDKEVKMTQIYEQGWVSSFLFTDPERVLWEVSQINNQPKTGTSKLANLGVLWLAAEDLEAQTAFYRDVIGLPLLDLDNRPRPLTEHAAQQQAETEPISGEPPVSLDKPRSAVFFPQGTRLAITGGGKTLEDRAERVWGKDTHFMGGFQAHRAQDFAEKLKSAGVKVDGTFYNEANGRVSFRFTDPEGNVWKVTD